MSLPFGEGVTHSVTNEGSIQVAGIRNKIQEPNVVLLSLPLGEGVTHSVTDEGFADFLHFYDPRKETFMTLISQPSADSFPLREALNFLFGLVS